jgi:hypothetical protein
MILESDFFFNGIPRWNLGWPTPNYAGAFLVTIACLFWAVQGKKYRIYILSTTVVIEAVLYFSLAKTYSRGSLIALLAGALFFIASSGRKSITRSWRLWAIRATILIACVAGTGLFNRIDPNLLTSDASVTNRLELWRGGMEMIASSPWIGWGSGESGRAYMNWFQDLERSEPYSTMVNSYLHVSVEYGLIHFTGVLIGLFTILMIAWRSGRTGDALAGAAGASITAWAVANMFTTLWIEPGLWIIPSIAMALVLWRARKRHYQSIRWIQLVAASAGVAVVLSCILYIGGTVSAKAYAWTLHPHRGGTIELISSAADINSPPVWHLWPDSTVFGLTPGKEMRRWAAETDAVHLYVHRVDSGKINKNGSSKGTLMLCGRHSERLVEPELLHFKALWLLHPSSPPPVSTATFDAIQNVTIVLPEIDETGLNSAWRSWAKHINARVLVTPGSGLDIRTSWPVMAPESRGVS